MTSIAFRRTFDLRAQVHMAITVVFAAAASFIAVAAPQLLVAAVAFPAALLLVVARPTTRVVATASVALVVAPDSPVVARLLGMPVTPRRVVLAAEMVACAIWLLRGAVKPKFPRGFAWAAYGLFVVIGALGNERPQGIPMWGFLFLAPYLLGAVLGATPELREGAIRGVTTGAFICAGAALLEFVMNRPFFPPVDAVSRYTRAGFLRANAGWQHPLALGMFLTLVTFVAVERASRRGAVPAVVAAAVLAGGIFVTQSRSALVGLVVGIAVFALLQPGLVARLRALPVIAAIVVAVLLFPGAGGRAFRGFVRSSVIPGAEAASNVVGRQTLLTLGVAEVRRHPLLGHGFGSVTNGTSNLLVMGVAYNDVANFPLALALETGLLGLAGFLVIVAWTLLDLVKRRRLRYAVGAAAGVTAAFITSVGVTALSSAVLFFFACGLFTGIDVRDE